MVPMASSPRPEREIDCGNSGTTMRLLSGILAAQPFTSRLVGDASLSKRPMRRIIEPLTQMGAKITALGANDAPPLVIHGAPLHAITYQMPIASAQVKSAILLAGLYATGVTHVIEPAPSRDHTERMLEYFLVNLRREETRVGSQTKAEGMPDLHAWQAADRVSRFRRAGRHFQRRVLAGGRRLPAWLPPAG